MAAVAAVRCCHAAAASDAPRASCSSRSSTFAAARPLATGRRARAEAVVASAVVQANHATTTHLTEHHPGAPLGFMGRGVAEAHPSEGPFAYPATPVRALSRTEFAAPTPAAA